MAYTYTRQSSFTDGDTITAAIFNDEYNQLVNAFAYTTVAGTTGHRHDGSTAQGGSVHTVGDLDFLNKIVADSTNNRWGVFVEVGGAAVEQIRIQDGAIVPVTDNDIDLGTSVLEFKDAYFDGTVTADAFAGPLTGAVTGTASLATAFTVSANNSTDETTYPLFVDGATGTQGAETDTGFTYNPSSGLLTIGGELDAASLDISGSADVDGTMEADAYTVDGTALNEYIADTVGAMVTSNTETNITVTYQDADNTLDFVALGTITALNNATENELVTIGSTTTELDAESGLTYDGSVLTVSGEVDATTLDISGNADIDGILEADAYTVDGTTLAEYIADTVGAMLTGNTETNITVTYQDGDNTIDFVSLGTITALNNATENELVTIGSTTTELDAESGLTYDGSTLVVTGDIDLSGDIDVDGTMEADAITLGGVTLAETIADTVGAMVTSNTETDIVVTYEDSDNTLDFVVSNISGTAALATSITAVANNSTDETVYPTFIDGATGTQGIETDTGLTYNPSTGMLTTTGVTATFTGNITGNVTGNTSGTAATVTTAAQTNITSLGTLTALTVDNLGINGNTITANSGAVNITPAAGSAIVLDGTINVDAGVVTGATSITSTAFVGDITGDVTGNASGTALTVTQAAQTSITSVGTLTALTVDDVAIDGKVITMTGDTSDTAVFTAGSNGTLAITTTDAAAAAANITITADGTFEAIGTTVTLDSGGAINLEPASGSAILLDGTISVDAGVVTGATSITSTAFVGALTGNASGTAATVTGGTQASITTLANATTVGALNAGSITSGFGTIDTGSSAITTTGLISGGSLDIDDVLINGTTIGHTDDTDLITIADGIATIAGEISVTTLDIGGTNVTSTAAELNILDGVTSTAAELNILDGVNSTAAELNIMDGGTAASSTTLEDADRLVVNDNGTMKQVAMTDFDSDRFSIVTSAPGSGTGKRTGHVWYVV